jgi:hypothetical protein
LPQHVHVDARQALRSVAVTQLVRVSECVVAVALPVTPASVYR